MSTLASRTGREVHWRSRLTRSGNYPGARTAQRYLHDVVAPALNALAVGPRESGVDVTVECT